MSARLRALNGVPFIAERTMWWADGGWFEAHNSPGAIDDRHALARLGRRGRRPAALLDLRAARQHVAVRRPGARDAPARRRRHAESAAFAVAANSRFNVDVGTLFPDADDRRFSTLVESLGADPAELVVEWSLYGTPGARPWELGANALAMNLSTPLRTLDRRRRSSAAAAPSRSTRGAPSPARRRRPFR